MSSDLTISNMIKAAEFYRRQGLLEETLKQYQKVEQLLQKKKKIKNKEFLLKNISSQIESVSREMKLFQDDKVPEVSPTARNIMQTMFSLDDPEVKGSVLLGEAITLAKFGQYASAMEAFKKIFAYSHLRIEAAKKMLQYGLDNEGKEEMLLLIQSWENDQRFTREDRNNLIKHLQGLLKKQEGNKSESSETA